jgi:competence protein ComEC
LWRSGAPVSWFFLAPPLALVALLPLPRAWRGGALALLLSVFLLREPRPREGELWIDVPDAGRSSAVVLRTRERLLLWGTGESFGSKGRAFTRHVRPLLQASAHDVVDLWLPGNLTRDVQAALALGATEWPVHSALVPPARGVPPEMQGCSEQAWTWNGIAFDLRAGNDGRTCLLSASVGTQRLQLGGTEPTALAADAGEVARFVLDARGLQQRHRHLRL